MNTGFIICTVSGWYWSAFLQSKTGNSFHDVKYSIFETKEIAENKMKEALLLWANKGASGTILTIQKVYYN